MAVSHDKVAWLIRQAERYPPLTAQEEIIFSRLIQEGVEYLSIPDDQLNQDELRLKHQSLNYIEKMVMANIKLVVCIVNKRYLTSQVPIQDIISQGLEGLRKATIKYDATKGYRFSTYSHWWIRQAITKFLNSYRIVRLPAHVSDKLNKMRKYVREYALENGHPPSKEYLAEKLEVTSLKLDELLIYHNRIASLNAKTKSDDGESELLDFVQDNTSILPEDYLQHEAFTKDINTALAILDERERAMVKLKHGFYNNECLSLQAIADIYGLSRERCRQIINKALSKLRADHRVCDSLKHYIT